jgi:hypothetical protein
MCWTQPHTNNTNNVNKISTYLIYVISVVCMWWCSAHILFTLFVLFVCGGVQHILGFLCCIFVYLIYVIVNKICAGHNHTQTTQIT